MSTALVMFGLWSVIASQVAGQDAPEAIHIAERQTIGLLLAAPSGDGARAPRAEITRTLEARLRHDTGLVSTPIEEALLRKCQGALGCVARALSAKKLELLVVVSVVRGRDVDRVGLTLLDVAAAMDLARGQKDEDELEVLVERRAVLASVTELAVRDVSELQSELDRTFDDAIRPVLEARRMWRPFGAIAVLLTPPTREPIALDGRVVARGSGTESSVLLDDVPAGAHRLRLGAAAEEEIIVEGGQTARVTLGASPAPSRTMSTAMRWGGVGLVAAGATLVTVAALRHDGSVRTACFRGAPGCESTSALESFAYDPSGGLHDPIDPGGLRPLPLGGALLVTGSVFTVASIVRGDTRRAPWLELAIGVAAGLLTYGVWTAAAN